MSIESIIIVGILLCCATVLIFVYINIKYLAKTLDEERFLRQKEQENMRSFWYEKLSSFDTKQLQSAKAVQEQIEKNAELFIKISTSLEVMQKNLNMFLHEKLEALGEKISSSLKEQQIQSAKDFENLSKKVDERLEKINEKVENRLKSGFENIDKTFKEIITGIAKINQAQKTIENLSGEVVSLQSILTDKKTRGIFGEVQLNAILKSIFGERKDLYDIQFTLSNSNIADAVIKAPEPVGLICVDSKFPLENYRKMSEDKSFQNDFRNDLKKHINDIASKYIIKGETSNLAVLFLPAEAIFAEINAYHESIIDYARQKSVWIASPTTLMALLTTIMAVVRDIKTKEQAKKIQEELMKLSKNFKLYKERWEQLSKHIDTVHKDVKEISVTTSKISDEFSRIENVEFGDDAKSLEEFSELDAAKISEI
ncbi:MAG: DNA recombination protein RmuC [Campylobacteraceae bacterium]|jgi:DNA recombination protein RmuC|nr:DNA recombination protein RmuC [Campylobacteraceae bacterium]